MLKVIPAIKARAESIPGSQKLETQGRPRALHSPWVSMVPGYLCSVSEDWPAESGAEKIVFLRVRQAKIFL